MGKWKLSPSQWPGGYYVPDFCTGPGVMLSPDSLSRILQQYDMLDEKNKHFPLEDVLFTGVLRKLAAIEDVSDFGGVCDHLGARQGLRTRQLETLLQERIAEI